MKKSLIVTLLFAVFLFGLSGCGNKEENVIKIGAILPLTGDAAKWGESSQNGIEQAAMEINELGGINGKKLIIIYEDDHGSTKSAVDAMKKITTVDKVPLVLGTLFSSATLAISPIAEEKQTVLLSPASTAPKISYAGDYIFRNCVSDVLEGQKMANFAYDTLGYTKASIMYINNDYGLGLKNAFKDQYEKLGGKIVLIETFEQGATDFRTSITKLKNIDVDFIYLPGYPPEMARILKQSREMGLYKQFLSIVVFEDKRLLEIAGEAAEGTIFSSRVYDPKSKDQVVVKFYKKYKNKYGAEPDIYAGLSYDAMKITAIAINMKDSKSHNIKNSLYKIKDFKGVTGITSFDNNGDVIKPIKMKILSQGKFIWYNKY